MGLRARTFWAGLALILSVFAVYGRVASHAFVSFDTRDYLLDNPFVLRGVTLEGVRWAFVSSHAANWHPLTWLSHMLDVQVFGLRPGPMHLENVALHAASSVLLFLFLLRATARFGPSLCVAALFALHPLHVESVAWVVERKDVLSAFFGLLCLLLWSAWTRAGGAWRYLAALLAFAFGLLAKPMLVTWPCVLLLLDLWPLSRGGLGARRLFLEKLPYFVLAGASCALTLWAQRAGGAVQDLERLPLVARLGNAVLAYAAYLGRAFWPAGLSFYYPHPVADIRAGPLVLAGLVLLAVTAAAIRLRERAPWFLVGWLFYLGTLVPVIGLVQVGGQATADRYTYLPLVGVFLVVAWGGAELASRSRAAVAIAGVTVIAALAILARRQVGFWKDTASLCERAIEVDPANHVAHDLLGVDRMEHGRVEEAIAEYDAALAAAPADVDALNNRAVALQRLARFDEAEASFRRAIERAPERAKLRHNLALLLQVRGRAEEALAEIDVALSLDPGSARARLTRAQALEALGRDVESGAELERALSIVPDYVAARLTLARSFVRRGELDPAEREIRRALASGPDESELLEARRGLARVLAAQGRQREAAAELEAVLNAQPEWPLAMADLAWVLATATDPALADPARALDLAGRATRATAERQAGILDAFAAACAANGRFADACTTAEKAARRARENGEDGLAARIEKRLESYRAGRVDLETPR